MKGLFLSDIHSGHQSGLTPPEYQWSRNSRRADTRKWAEMQARIWDFYLESLAKIGRPDICGYLGDAIEGKGERSGGTELVAADRTDQAIMAAESLKMIRAKKLVMVRGTPSHTGVLDDYENMVAKLVCADKIGDHEWLDIDGVIFDLKHKIGTSGVPGGRNTALNRAELWNVLWAERGLQPKARVFLRGHAHYFRFGGDARRFSMILPGMQGWTKFGGKECEGTIDLGMVEFECEEGQFRWQEHLLNFQWAAAKPFKV